MIAVENELLTADDHVEEHIVTILVPALGVPVVRQRYTITGRKEPRDPPDTALGMPGGRQLQLRGEPREHTATGNSPACRQIQVLGGHVQGVV